MTTTDETTTFEDTHSHNMYNPCDNSPPSEREYCIKPRIELLLSCNHVAFNLAKGRENVRNLLTGRREKFRLASKFLSVR